MLTTYERVPQRPQWSAFAERAERATGGRFMFDLDAWAELADIYLVQGMYQQAAFCQEELITGAPHNYLHHLQYAEVRASLQARFRTQGSQAVVMNR